MHTHISRLVDMLATTIFSTDFGQWCDIMNSGFPLGSVYLVVDSIFIAISS